MQTSSIDIAAKIPSNIEEEKRGFYPEENHVVPGVYEIEIEPNEEKELSFVCSLEENIEEKNVKVLIEQEENRLDKMIKETGLIDEKEKKTKTQKSKDELLKTYLIAT